MKRLTLVGAALAALAGMAHGQYWKALGRGSVGPNGPNCLFGDSVADRLLMGGNFAKFRNTTDTVLCMGQAAWNGSRWDSLAHRISLYEGSTYAWPTYWYLRYQGNLYACGEFGFLQDNGDWACNMARLDEVTQKWEGLGCNVPGNNGILTLVPKSPGTTLYGTGHYYDLCGLAQSCVFSYDGTSFSRWEPFDQIPVYGNNWPGDIFEFKGKTYMTGLFRDPLSEGFANFLRWNGTSWEHVPGWENYAGHIKELLVHNDTLYVAGAIRKANGGPGNGVAAFDGETWDDLGGGVLNTNLLANTIAMDLEWYHGHLLVSGRFTQAGGEVPCQSIAMWNGHQWCSFPGDLRSDGGGLPTFYDMAVWRDSLYVCGSVYTVDGDTMRQVLQWLGGDAVGACSTVGVGQVATERGAGLSISPLPVPGQWTVHFPRSASWELAAYNSVGQQVGAWHAGGNATTIDLTGQAAGLYVLRAQAADGQVHTAKLVRP